MKYRLLLLLAALLFSTGGAAIKAVSLTSWQIASFRSGIAVLAILLLAPASRKGWNWRVLLVAMAHAATMALFVAANRLTTSANAIFLQDTAPFYLLLLGPWLLHERVRARDLWFMGAMVAGMLLFFLSVDAPVSTAPHPAQGNVLALLSAVAWALTVAGLRWLSRGEGGAQAGMATVAAGNLLAFLVCLPAALPVAGVGARDAVVLLYLGIVQIALGYLCLTKGVAEVPALEASTVLLLEPALNPVWAWLVHGERPSAGAIGGGALILCATAWKTWSDARLPDPVSPAPDPG